jgi:hypothetical protein
MSVQDGTDTGLPRQHAVQHGLGGRPRRAWLDALPALVDQHKIIVGQPALVLAARG